MMSFHADLAGLSSHGNTVIRPLGSGGFPPLRDILSEALANAPAGVVYVASQFRTGSGNLRKQFRSIIERAGLKPWPKLFVNLRASRAIELSHEHPQHVCSAWMGHSATVAAEHYLRVTESDFELACAAKSLASIGASQGRSRTERKIAQKKTAFQTREPVSISERGISAGTNGRYWTRTSDLMDVDHAL